MAHGRAVPNSILGLVLGDVVVVLPYASRANNLEGVRYLSCSFHLIHEFILPLWAASKISSAREAAEVQKARGGTISLMFGMVSTSGSTIRKECATDGF